MRIQFETRYGQGRLYTRKGNCIVSGGSSFSVLWIGIQMVINSFLLNQDASGVFRILRSFPGSRLNERNQKAGEII